MKLTKNIEETLQKARDTYGSKNQILVCIEELNELACVLAKYPRYDDENEAKNSLHDKVLDEVADVFIILNHVQSILSIEDSEIFDRVYEKTKRLERWLNNSDSMQRTVEDRAVEKIGCMSCENWENPEANMCKTCLAAEATDGVRPFYKPKKKE